MTRTIDDITSFIFMNDAPKPSDVILIPRSSQHEITETLLNYIMQDMHHIYCHPHCIRQRCLKG